MIYEQYAFEMVYLMLNTNRQQALCFELTLVISFIDIFNTDAFRPLYIRVVLR